MNVSDIIDSTQTAVAHYEYAPFGKTVYSSGALSLANPYRFSSEYADDTLGLVYYNYRHYNPLIGRWTGRDPVDAINLYYMAGNSNKNDILGLSFDAIGGFEDVMISMGMSRNYVESQILAQESVKYISTPPYTENNSRYRIYKGCKQVRTCKRRDPNRKIVVNGCGSKGNVYFVPDAPYWDTVQMLSGVNFEQICNRHDLCYGTCQLKGSDGKKDCDAQFLESMMSECEKVPNLLILHKTHCRKIAWLYYWFVDEAGYDAYESAQDEDCYWEEIK